ncbi:MAG: ABC transporter ATP-binding protein [Oscillospiraceae bacterium]|jgi:ABC-2 type transport system ATP-binding protein|nr:ABC transporter ATP-binding protein [Oscillospiraceae bacterium]
MIEVRNVTKRYGERFALRDISFSAAGGEILGVLGPNGAGKTTAMNIITGYLSSGEGEVTVGGFEIFKEPMKAKRQMGYLPEQPPLYQDMTVSEYLSFAWDLKGLGRKNKKDSIAEVMRRVKIDDVEKRRIRNLSKGYRQRVGLGQALLGAPGAIILDEPTVGLDPRQIIEMRELIRSLGKKHTVLLSSHILSEVQAVCDRIVVINKGRLVADGTPKSLSDSLEKTGRLHLRIAGAAKKIRSALEGAAGVAALREEPAFEEKATDWLVIPKEGVRDIRKNIFYALAEARLPILHMRGEELTLEEIFLRLTQEPDSPEEDAAARTPAREEAAEGGRQ